MASKTKSTLLAAGAGALVGGGVGAAAGALWIKGQAHWKANEWVNKYQNPWGDKAIAFMNQLSADQKAGTLTYEDAQKRQTQFEENVGDFWDQATLFEGKGGDQKKVIGQAHTKLDPIVEGWRTSIQQSIDALKPADPLAGTDETKPPTMPGDANAQGDAAAQRQKKHAMGAPGRASTILTSPLGLTSLPDEQRKYTTLLGY
jgi:hypothetical protein